MSDPYQCQFCSAGIPMADINVSTDIALCRVCGKTMPFSEIAPIPGAAAIDINQPPKGIYIEESPIRGKSIIYKKVSPVVIFLIPFTAVWSGISMFGIYGTQIQKGEFELAQSLFGLPFLIGTVVLVSSILYCLFGRLRVSCNHGLMEVVAEIGPVGWTRRISYDRSTRVGIKTAGWTKNGNPQEAIHIESQGKTLKFGATIPSEAKNFMAEVVRRTVTEGM